MAQAAHTLVFGLVIGALRGAPVQPNIAAIARSQIPGKYVVVASTIANILVPHF